MPVPDQAAAPDPRLVAAVGIDRAHDLLSGVTNERERVAFHRRAEVERLSREGVRVRDIAAQLGIHPDYVVALRGQLGVGRKR